MDRDFGDYHVLADAVLSYVLPARHFEGNEGLRLDQLVDGRFFHHFLLQIDGEYFQDTMISAASSENLANNWVLNAARLKRTYLRLLSHYSLVLGKDPTKLPVPDFNQIAMRRHAEWLMHFVRMAGIVMFAGRVASTRTSSTGGSSARVGWFVRHLEGCPKGHQAALIQFLDHIKEILDQGPNEFQPVEWEPARSSRIFSFPSTNSSSGSGSGSGSGGSSAVHDVPVPSASTEPHQQKPPRKSVPTLYGPIEPIEYPRLPESKPHTIKVDAQAATPAAVDPTKPSAPHEADAQRQQWQAQHHPRQQQPSREQPEWNPNPQQTSHHELQGHPQPQWDPQQQPAQQYRLQSSPQKQQAQRPSQWDPDQIAQPQQASHPEQRPVQPVAPQPQRRPTHRASVAERTSPSRKASGREPQPDASMVDSSGAPFVLPTIKRVPSVVDLVDEEKQDFIRRIDQLEHQHPTESVRSAASSHHRGIETAAEDGLAKSIQQHEREEELEAELRQLQQLQQEQEGKPHGDMRSIEEIAVLEIELDSLKSRLSSEAQTVADLKAELESVAPRMGLLESELAAKDALVQTLQRQLETKATGGGEELELMLEATRNSEEALRAELKASSADLEAVEKKLVGKERRGRELEGQIRDMEAGLERTEGQLRAILGLLSANGDEIDADDVVPAVKAMIEQRARSEERIDLLQTHVDLTETQLEDMAAEKADWEQQRRRLHDEIARLTKENEKLMAENAGLGQEKEKQKTAQQHEQKAAGSSPTSLLPTGFFKGSDEDSATALFQSAALQEAKNTTAAVTGAGPSSSGSKAPPSVIPSDIWGSTTSSAAAAWPFTAGTETEEVSTGVSVPERSHSSLEQQPKQQPCLSNETYIKSTGDLDSGVFVDAAKGKVVEALRQELHQKDVQMKALLEELEGLRLKQGEDEGDEEDMEEVEGLIELAKDEIVELRAELADKDQIIDRLNEQLNALFASEAMKANKQTSSEASADEVEGLKAHVARLEAHRQQLSQFIATKLGENAKRLDRLGSLQGSIEQACTTMEGPRVRELEAMVARLKADLAAASRKEGDMERVLIEEKDAEIERLKESVERLESAHREQSQFIEAQLKGSGERLGRLEQLQGSIEGAFGTLEGSRVKELESTIAELKRHAGEMEGALQDPGLLADLRGRHEERAAEFNALKDSNEDRLHRLESLQSRILAVCEAFDGDTLSGHFASGLEPAREALIRLREAVISLITRLDELHAGRMGGTAADGHGDPSTAEHRMIMAAWHDLGMRLMRMNYHAVHHSS